MTREFDRALTAAARIVENPNFYGDETTSVIARAVIALNRRLQTMTDARDAVVELRDEARAERDSAIRQRDVEAADARNFLRDCGEARRLLAEARREVVKAQNLSAHDVASLQAANTLLAKERQRGDAFAVDLANMRLDLAKMTAYAVELEKGNVETAPPYLRLKAENERLQAQLQKCYLDPEAAISSYKFAADCAKHDLERARAQHAVTVQTVHDACDRERADHAKTIADVARGVGCERRDGRPPKLDDVMFSIGLLRASATGVEEQCRQRDAAKEAARSAKVQAEIYTRDLRAIAKALGVQLTSNAGYSYGDLTRAEAEAIYSAVCDRAASNTNAAFLHKLRAALVKSDSFYAVPSALFSADQIVQRVDAIGGELLRHRESIAKKSARLEIARTALQQIVDTQGQGVQYRAIASDALARSVPTLNETHPGARPQQTAPGLFEKMLDAELARMSADFLKAHPPMFNLPPQIHDEASYTFGMWDRPFGRLRFSGADFADASDKLKRAAAQISSMPPGRMFLQDAEPVAITSCPGGFGAVRLTGNIAAILGPDPVVASCDTRSTTSDPVTVTLKIVARRVKP